MQADEIEAVEKLKSEVIIDFGFPNFTTSQRNYSSKNRVATINSGNQF
jgi:hypothetical protein